MTKEATSARGFRSGDNRRSASECAALYNTSASRCKRNFYKSRRALKEPFNYAVNDARESLAVPQKPRDAPSSASRLGPFVSPIRVLLDEDRAPLHLHIAKVRAT